MDMSLFLVVVFSGTGDVVLAFNGFQRAACLVGLPGQCYWLHQTWGGPVEFFVVAVAATAAYLLGICIHWVHPWWSVEATAAPAAAPRPLVARRR